MTFLTLPSKMSSSDVGNLGGPKGSSSSIFVGPYFSSRQASASQADRVRNVHQILEEVEQELARDDWLDPTPIRMEGVKIVQHVPLSMNEWHNDESISELISTLLSPQDPNHGNAISERLGNENTELGFAMNQNTLMNNMGGRNICTSDMISNTSALFATCMPTPSNVGCHNGIMMDSSSSQIHPNLTLSGHGSSSSSSESNEGEGGAGQPRFRDYQSDQWLEKYQELLTHYQQHGHCLVSWKENHHLARWIKRQRYQYKLKIRNRHSTMTDGRVKALEQLGFTWDTHEASWDERFIELCAFKDFNGHCNVPSPYPENPKLGVWVKGQRRRYWQGKKKGRVLSGANAERVAKLKNLGFEFSIRSRKTS